MTAVMPSTAAEVTAAGWAAFRRARQQPWTPEASRAQSRLHLHLEICSRCLEAGAGITPDRLQQVQDATDELLRVLQEQAKSSDEGEAAA